MNEKLRAIAIDAGRAALDQWNDLPLEERRTTSLTDFQTAIVVRVCLEVAEAVRAEERQSRQALVEALRELIFPMDALIQARAVLAQEASQ